MKNQRPLRAQIPSSLFYYLKTVFGIKCLLSVLSALFYLINRYNLFLESNYITINVWKWSLAVFVAISVVDALSFIKNLFDMYMHNEWETIPDRYEQLRRDMNVSIKKFGYNQKIFNAYYFNKSVVVGKKLHEVLNDEEEIAIVAHEFSHGLWVYNFLYELVAGVLVILLLIGKYGDIAILNALADPKFLIHLLFLLYIPINWKREIDSDMKATDYVEAEHLQHALKILSKGKIDNPKWTHPSIRTRIEILEKRRVCVGLNSIPNAHFTGSPRKPANPRETPTGSKSR